MTCDYNSQIPPYLRVLGWNDKGTEILRTARRTASLPIVMRGGDLKKLAEGALTIAQSGSRAEDLYSLSSPEIQPCGLDFTSSAARQRS